MRQNGAKLALDSRFICAKWTPIVFLWQLLLVFWKLHIFYDKYRRTIILWALCFMACHPVVARKTNLVEGNISIVKPVKKLKSSKLAMKRWWYLACNFLASPLELFIADITVRTKIDFINFPQSQTVWGLIFRRPIKLYQLKFNLLSDTNTKSAISIVSKLWLVRCDFLWGAVT